MSYEMTYEELEAGMWPGPGDRARMNGPEALVGMINRPSSRQVFALLVEGARVHFAGRDTVLGMREVGLAIGGLRGAHAVIAAFRDSYIYRDSDDDIDAAAYAAMVDALAQQMLSAAAVAMVVLRDPAVDARLRDAAETLAGDLGRLVGLAAGADETYAAVVPQDVRDQLNRVASTGNAQQGGEHLAGC
jgi:hypothetical protein